MSVRLPEVDVVIVGMGWAGSILARELTRAGLEVVGLERGPRRSPSEDFTLPGVRDELKFAVRQELFQDAQAETVTHRHASAQTAAPIRRLGAFLPGNGVGGAGSHWAGLTFRNAPFDFEVRSRLIERYGRDSIPEDMPVQDFGVTYAELEPHYDRFEKLCGVSGKAGNLRGRRIEGGNIFEGPRRNEYPNPPLTASLGGELFTNAARELGMHPFPAPASNASASYVNPEGLRLGRCAYCGHCDRFGCEVNAKASPNTTLVPVLETEPRFTLRDHAYVRELDYDRAARRIRSVRYVDMRSGREYEQPAGLVLLCAYVFNNVLLLRVSGVGEPYDPKTGKGVVGKNYCYQIGENVQIFDETREFNPFMGAGGLAVTADDYNCDNIDHGALGYFGGGAIMTMSVGARPIMSRPTPPGTPRWGGEWKRATAKWYRRNYSVAFGGASYPHRENYLDLDPNYRDVLGRPLLRMTYNFTSNDRRMAAHLGDVAERVAVAAGAKLRARTHVTAGDFNVRPYQSTHNTGGAIMGLSPAVSVVNRYLQSWDAHNLFVVGASAFPQNSAYAPTGTVGALAYWAASAITRDYLKNPGPLVFA